jgi:hypothetical protein
MKKNTIIISFEILSILSTIAFGILWFTNPESQSHYQPLFTSFSALLALAIDLYRRNIKNQRTQKCTTLSLNPANTIICRYLHKANVSSFCIAIYDMHIVNISDFNYTIKDVSLEYHVNGENKTSEAINVLTDSAYSPHAKTEVDTLYIYSPFKIVGLYNWKNMSEELSSNNVLIPGAVLRASGLFVLDIKDFTEISDIKDFNLVITDYMDMKTKHPVSLSEEFWKPFKGAYIKYSSTLVK